MARERKCGGVQRRRRILEKGRCSNTGRKSETTEIWPELLLQEPRTPAAMALPLLKLHGSGPRPSPAVPLPRIPARASPLLSRASHFSPLSSPPIATRRCAVPAMASATLRAAAIAQGVTCAIPPPVHPTYDLLQVIRGALAEDAGDLGAYSTPLNSFLATSHSLLPVNLTGPGIGFQSLP